MTSIRTDCGNSLFVVLGLVSVSVLAASIFTAMSVRIERIEKLRALHAQAYWLARSEAKHALNVVQSGQRTGWVKTYALGVVDVNIADGAVVSIRVTAKVDNAADTLSLTYDTTQHTLLSWQDNGP